MTFLEEIKELLAKIGILKYLKGILKRPYYIYQKILFQNGSQKSLELINKLISISKVQAWIEFGTYLGAYRGGKIISHDLDIDFGVFATEDFSSLEALLIQNGFKLKREMRLKSTNAIVEKTFGYKGANIDFFFFFDNGSHFISYDFSSASGLTWGETIEKFGGLLAYQNTMSKFNFGEKELNGLIFISPSDTDAVTHLSELYGTDFTIRNPNWKLNDRVVRKKIDDIGIIKF